MEKEIQEFKCPQCGGKLEFDIETQKLTCPFCGYSCEIEETVSSIGDDHPGWNVRSSEWQISETDEIQNFVCKSCGGEIITDKTTAATHCPFCGNPVVLSERVGGMIKPDYVIPFKFTKEDAKNELKKFVKSQRFAPSSFAKENRLNEIKGVYVPFWLFDSHAEVFAQFEATNIKRWSDGAYDCSEVSYYDVFRAGGMDFANIPVDASEKMPDDLMDSLEPFDFSQAVNFNTEYLSGFFADRFDVTLDSCAERADTRIKNSAIATMRGAVSGYSTVSCKQSSVKVLPSATKYALYPVWILNTQYHGTKYRFSMNGQTGKFVGRVPFSKGKLAGLFSAVAVSVTAVLWGLGFLIGLY